MPVPGGAFSSGDGGDDARLVVSIVRGLSEGVAGGSCSSPSPAPSPMAASRSLNLVSCSSAARSSVVACRVASGVRSSRNESRPRPRLTPGLRGFRLAAEPASDTSRDGVSIELAPRGLKSSNLTAALLGNACRNPVTGHGHRRGHVGCSRGPSGRPARRSTRREPFGRVRAPFEPPFSLDDVRLDRHGVVIARSLLRWALAPCVLRAAQPHHPRSLRRGVHRESHRAGHREDERRQQGVQRRHHPVREGPTARRPPRSHAIGIGHSRRGRRHGRRGRRARLHRGGTRDGAT